MKLFVNFKQKNPEFDLEYAKEYKNGKESVGNEKYLLEKGYMINDIDQAELIENEVLKLTPIDTSIQALLIPNMTILKCKTSEEECLEFAVSSDLLQNIHSTFNQKYNTTRYYFYFKQRDDFSEFIPGVFVINKDIPSIK